jgi:8-oxo-dGTP pyrophosphatase MutT (NUDIX family)
VCGAFEQGIPKDILVNRVSHREPYPGDNGLHFQSKLPVRAAGVMFVAPDGAVLLLRRSPQASDHQGEWAFPGGGLEQGETAAEAARREAIEECGPHPDGELVELTRSVREGVDFTTFLQRLPERFDPVLNEEHDSFKWVVPGELNSPQDSRADSVADNWDPILRRLEELTCA